MNKHLKLDTNFLHPPVLLEKKILYHITQGDTKTSLKILEEINQPTRTHLADDPIRSLQNSIIISISLFTRAVLNAGVNYEDAFDETDHLIRQISKLSDEEELLELERSVVKSFCKKVKAHHMNSKHSYHISRVKSYVAKNINKKISSKDIAQALSLNQSYLAKLFKQEMNITLTYFITLEKINAAKELIEFSNLSFSNIASLLCFTDQSHFTRQFKMITQLTPKAYLHQLQKSHLK